MNQQQTFYVRFLGSNLERAITARTMAEAKREFARLEGVRLSSYIVAARKANAITRASA